MKNIYLIGFMGTGKTTTGKLLAEKMGVSFVDLDIEIEKEAGLRIPEIFEKHGEPYFRSLEKKMTRRMSERANLIVATGGGTIKDAENRTVLRASGTVIALMADADTVLERTLTKGARPVLDAADEGNRKKAIEDLIAERKAFYEDADFTIDTANRTPLQVVDEILAKIKRY
ncbi:shikimate kinase [Selenomonas sp. TAMA-11512]|uniref:shikimate kinase n=1 Tax=Selenomonas sp. TAMA-11512 TaxID=3095337 RepID=UPI0030888C25|nr:shikimate kinase [Selenomonas sp. TAMA-11512]